MIIKCWRKSALSSKNVLTCNLCSNIKYYTFYNIHKQNIQTKWNSHEEALKV